VLDKSEPSHDDARDAEREDIHANLARQAAEHERERAADKARIAELEAKLAQHQKDCDACGGEGVPESGLPCMCKGTGRAAEACTTLRELLVEAERERDEAKRYGREKCEETGRQQVEAQRWRNEAEANSQAASELARLCTFTPKLLVGLCDPGCKDCDECRTLLLPDNQPSGATQP